MIGQNVITMVQILLVPVTSPPPNVRIYDDNSTNNGAGPNPPAESLWYVDPLVVKKIFT